MFEFWQEGTKNDSGSNTMIRLTLNPTSRPEIRCFHKSALLLGSDATQVDVQLPLSAIEPVHLQIMDQNGFPILINLINDPKVLVNGHPFGKKLLNSGDLILVHHLPILFENFPSSRGADTATPSPVVPLSALLPTEEKEKNGNSALPAEEEVAVEQKKTGSLKDDYLKDLDDEAQGIDFESSSEPSHLYQAWKKILLFIFSLFTLSGLVATVIYLTVSDTVEVQETRAARGVADVAIALAHAQLNHLKPQNQNWSDVDFLKNNLQAVLPDEHSHAVQIDAQGQFRGCPYGLRIYTSSDLSHFLLIAQPTPNFSYWLIPQSIIVVDSHLMELRRLQDVRGLNRLLANPDPLGGTNGQEIIRLVKQGQLIPLSALVEERGVADFIPPRNLARARPGAENAIYNAPRYYRLGQQLIQQAIRLSTSKGSSHEVARLKQEIVNCSWLNHLILYAPGKTSAVLAREGITLFAPSNQLLFGYLLFNVKGDVDQARLLKDEDEGNEFLTAIHGADGEVAILALGEIEEGVGNKQANAAIVDHNHPIYIQLQMLVNARENELKPLASAVHSLLNEELQTPRPLFQEEFQARADAYFLADLKHQQVLKEAIDTLYQEYEEMPVEEFLPFVKELRLDALMQQADRSIMVSDEHCQQNMETLLTQIEGSNSLIELHNVMQIANTWLNFDYIKNPQELVKYQTLLRNQLLDEVAKYVLTEKKNPSLTSDDRQMLEAILNQERLIRPEEKKFFLEIFDERTSLNHPGDQEDRSAP